MRVIYRISEAGYPKEKPGYINNKNCFANFVKHFSNAELLVIADNCNSDTLAFIKEHTDRVLEVSVGHGSGTFNLALDFALKQAEEDLIYFVENDYVHRAGAYEAMIEAFDSDLLFDYLTLYDHPDKYLNPYEGGNPFCSAKSEQTRVFLTSSSHWKYTNSTTMTFASRVRTLKQDETTLRKWTSGTHPEDFQMFIELYKKGRRLLSPIPGFSTHGESKWLTPLINWEKAL